MQRLLISMVCLAVVLVASGTASANGVRFTAVLSGDQEVPPVDTATTGKAKFIVNRAETALRFELDVRNGEGILGAAGAHIHCAPAGQNGTVAAFLAGVLPGGLDGRLKVKGTLSDANVMATACGATLSALVQSMRDGNTYVNVHSLANAGGEVRGQIR